MDGSITSIDFECQVTDEESGTVVRLESGERGPLNSVENFCRILERDNRIRGSICYNELNYRRWVRGALPWEPEPVDRPWTDSDEAWLRRWIWTQYRLRGKEDLNDAIQIAETLKTINPIKEFMNGLKWDGTPRIATALHDYLGAEKSEYTAEVMKVFLLGGVARVFKPGTKFDLAMILVGPQGVGKSTFLSRLAIKTEWFNDGLKTLDGDTKRIAEQLSGRFIIELGELAAMKRTADIESVKQFITAQFDVYRLPYAKYEQQRPRVCIFAGTTNSGSFLVDKTGGRRFLPIEVGGRKPTRSLFDDDCEEYFTQLWAEAVTIYKSGEYSLVLSKAMEAQAEEHRETYQEEDVREGIIQEWLDNTKKEIVCAPMLFTEALNELGKPNRRESNEIHEIMRMKIKGWKLHPATNGRARCGHYGKQVCYVRDNITSYSPKNGEEVELI